MTNLLVVFSHGKESGPWGSKIRALAEVAQRLGAQVMSINYREHPQGVVHDQDAAGEAERRVAQLLATPLPSHEQLVLVGSSMGGYVSTVASQQLDLGGLFLMAPALYLPGYAHQEPAPHSRLTLVVHGWRDDVVPASNSIRFARQHRCDLHLLDGDHRLNEALPKIVPLFDLFMRQVMESVPRSDTHQNESNVDDPLYAVARELVLTEQNPSVAFLQRRFLIGYRRAQELMQRLEGDIVTVPGGDGWRRMLQSGRNSPDSPSRAQES